MNTSTTVLKKTATELKEKKITTLVERHGHWIILSCNNFHVYIHFFCTLFSIRQDRGEGGGVKITFMKWILPYKESIWYHRCKMLMSVHICNASSLCPWSLSIQCNVQNSITVFFLVASLLHIQLTITWNSTSRTFLHSFHHTHKKKESQ